MAFRIDVANNWIRVDVAVDMNHHEESADYIVKTMNNYCPRSQLRTYGHVRLTHLEMSAELFDRIEQLHNRFPAFRITAFRQLKARRVLGILCGNTVYRNDTIDNCIQFQYTDVLVRDTDAMTDPAFINHPKAAASPFVYS